MAVIVIKVLFIRNQFVEQLLKHNVELEHFETYKPSLNDIFVAKAGQ